MTTATWALVITSTLAGQTVGTLEFGASVVEYDGFLVSGAAVLSPSLTYDTPTLSAGAQGTWVIFESGNEILQTTAAIAWLTPPTKGWRLEFSGSLGASRYANESAFGHVFGRTRLHYQNENRGAWLSGAAGSSFTTSTSATPLELSGGVWTVQNNLALVGTLTSTWIGTDHYTDVVGALRWSVRRAELETHVGLRPLNAADENDPALFTEISARLNVGRRLALTASGGSYPSDPARGVLAAQYITVGLKVNVFGSTASGEPIIAGALIRAANDLAASDHALGARMEIIGAQTVKTLRIYTGAAESVELMGDFTDWLPAALSRTLAGFWELQVTVTPGVYRLNVRVDGGPWLVPEGARLEENEFGGAVGVVVIQ